jgi:DNA polymerase-3 subunit gamma/tau
MDADRCARRILARGLNYKTAAIDQPSVHLTELGEHCQAIMEGRHVDVIEMDAASHTGIDDIREIIEQVRYRPVSARYKVYIIDEVHMLSNQAFNGLLKTLEEPPPHVKFIFATTEIRKVPITVLSRCQRFDLRRIESGTLTSLLRKITGLENVQADDTALAMIARAGEGSARDSLSILDQAIAHGNGTVDSQTVREMLGLADRARIIDLFEMLMRGDVAGVLKEFRGQYDVGADPSVVLSDLADFNHLVTRLRFTPEVAQDMSLSEDERVRGAEFAKTLSIRALSRCWQMLLKGIHEVETSSRPVQAAEMLLIRLAHSADLPTLDEALKAIANGHTGGNSAPSAPQGGGGNGSGGGTTAYAAADAVSGQMVQRQNNGGAALRLAEPQNVTMRLAEPAAQQMMQPQAVVQPKTEPAPQAVRIRDLNDIVNLAGNKRDLQFKVLVKNFVRLVSIGQNRMEIALTEHAPKTLATDMAQRLLDWTGERWMVSVARDGGGQTVAEVETARREELVTDARADPDVAAILAKFPGAKIIDVRITTPDDDADMEMQMPDPGVDSGDLDDDD